DGEGTIPDSIAIAPKLLWDSELEREIPAPRRPRVLRTNEAGPKAPLPEVKLPIEPFASSISVAGDEVIAFALLDDRARRDVMSLVSEYGVVIVDGTMTWESGQIAVTADLMSDMASRMLAFAHRLALPKNEIAARLSINARSDPSPDMRRQNLILAIVHHPS